MTTKRQGAMGQLIDGKWSNDWYNTKDSGGAFVRDTARFRHWITADGSPGPGTSTGGFAAESGRYHLYVSYACPWAHRTLIVRALKQLNEHIGLSVVHPLMRDDGWTFATDFAGASGDTLLGKRFLREIYLAANPRASGRVTVPVLWDKQSNTIVSNESSEIIRMFGQAFDSITGNELDLYPQQHREAIDNWNALIYDKINNGVYRAGFATSQQAYQKAVHQLFAALDTLEERLASHPYLVGERATEADWRLFTTLVRFDPVYVGHFKCNLKRLIDYPHIYAYAKKLLSVPGVAATCDLQHIKTHYYASHDTINPTGVVPEGPVEHLLANLA